MARVTLEPRILLVFLAAGALFAGAPTLAHAHGDTDVGVAPAPATAGSAEAKLRAFETQAIGAEHADAHARQREVAQEAQRDGSATQTQARAAPAPAVANVGGKWGAARTIPVIAINAVMLPTGKVLMFAYPARPGSPGYEDPDDYDFAKAYVWDPVSGTSKQVDPPIDPDTGKPTNIWCGGASFLPDGRVLITGGNVDDPRTDFHGINTVFTFDPFTEEWDPPATNAPMAQGRWYPSQLLMPDGRSLIAGGFTRPGDADFVDPEHKTDNDLELISPNGTIERQPGFFNAAGRPPLSGLYPRTFWMPSGRALAVGPFAYDTWFLAPSSPGAPTAWTDAPNLPTDREWGTAVLLSGGRVMTLGGSRLSTAEPPEGELPTPGAPKRPAQSTTAVLDENKAAAGWQAAPAMKVGRSHANSVLLPGGKVATVGGGFGEDSGKELYRWLYSDEQKKVELLDTVTGESTLGAAQGEGRSYHSTALLLPDGRVFSAGDDVNGAPASADNPATSYDETRGEGTGVRSDTAEIYSPPYLFKADGSLASRPVIDPVAPFAQQAPPTTPMGAEFEIGASGPAATKAVLVAPGASTHATDMSQRLVPLAAPVPRPNGRLALTLPSDTDLAPPGYYMLFLLSADGVPSVSKFIRITAPADATSPVVTLTAPGQGSSTTDPTPTFAGAAGNLPGDRAASTVRVYAGSTATGPPMQTRTAARSGTSWTVDGSPALAAGTYTARAEQSDYAGNTGASSAITFTITSPPQPPPPPSKLTLTITGALPTMRTVKRKKRFVLTVAVSEPGTVTLDGLFERGKKQAKSLVGRRKVTFNAAGKRRVTFKLTRAGRRLLAGKRRGVVRVRARSAFKSARKLPVVQVRRKLR